MSDIQSDHDLLIRLDTRMSDLITSMKLWRDDHGFRIAAMEKNKAELAELVSLKKDIIATAETAEGRLQKVEKFVYIATGVTGVIQLVFVPVIIYWITHTI